MIRAAILDGLIEDALMRQYLAKHVPQVNQSEFNKVVADLQEDLKKSNKTYAEFLKKEGMTEDQLRRDILARLQWKNILLRFLPDEKAKAYYDANKIFFDKVMVRASHIMIQLQPNATQADKQAATQKALIWRQEIVSGKATFEDIAKQHSDCQVSKSKGAI